MSSTKHRFFSRRRETIEGRPYQDFIESVAKEPRSRNKLRKQPPPRRSEDIAAADLQLLMGNKTSKLGNVPRPTRPPRPSANDLPNLPSQPLYKALTAQQRHPPKVLDDNRDSPKPKIPEKSPSRRASISSRRPSFTGFDWPLGDKSERGRPSSRAAQTVPRKLYSCSADAAVNDKRRPPMYDRASHLAESYRALLPDRSDVESDYDVPITDEPEPLAAPTPTRTHKWSWDPREPNPQQQPKNPHSLLHLGNRPFLRSRSSAAKMSTKATEDPFVQNPRVPSWVGTSARTTPLSLPRASSTASSSSLTAVERCAPFNDPFIQASTSQHNSSTTTFTPDDEDDTHWNTQIDSDNGHYTWSQTQTSYYPQQHESSSHAHSYEQSSTHAYSYDPTTTTNHHTSLFQNSTSFQDSTPLLQIHHNRPQSTTHIPFPHTHPQRQQRRRTSDDLGLQICGDMLSDQLRKTFLGGNAKGNPESNKLQVLFMIEAYEATLESCRREVSHPPLTRGGEAEGIRKHHVREATRILDHWLGVLYGIYDEDFGGNGKGGSGGRTGEMF